MPLRRRYSNLMMREWEMNRGSGYALAFIFFLIPLPYSIDNDPYRAWEVFFWGGFTLLIALSRSAHLSVKPEFVAILSYSTVLILQQFFIPDGQLWFGAQYALVFAMAFFPSLVLGWLPWSINDFNRHWDGAIKGLSLIITINILGSRLFEFGEHYKNGPSVARSFGFLGDSITPVILFPLIYFFLERKYLWSILMIAVLLLTGGKMAALLLFIAPIFLASLKMRPIIRFILIWCTPIIALAMESSLNNFLLSYFADQNYAYSYNTRMLSIILGLEYFYNSPIWGVGINQSMGTIITDAEILAHYQYITEYWPVYQIHNAFVRALAETGMLGFGVLVGLCLLLIGRMFRALRVALDQPPSRCRSMVLAGGIWTVLFIVGYQSTGWFEHGHPQFAWLLIIAALTSVGARTLTLAPKHAA